MRAAAPPLCIVLVYPRTCCCALLTVLWTWVNDYLSHVHMFCINLKLPKKIRKQDNCPQQSTVSPCPTQLWKMFVDVLAVLCPRWGEKQHSNGLLHLSRRFHLCHCQFVCLLVTLHKNYWAHSHDDVTGDVCWFTITSNRTCIYCVERAVECGSSKLFLFSVWLQSTQWPQVVPKQHYVFIGAHRKMVGSDAISRFYIS